MLTNEINNRRFNKLNNLSTESKFLSYSYNVCTPFLPFDFHFYRTAQCLQSSNSPVMCNMYGRSSKICHRQISLPEMVLVACQPICLLAHRSRQHFRFDSFFTTFYFVVVISSNSSSVARASTEIRAHSHSER